MRVDHYRRLVNVERCLREGTQEKRKKGEAVQHGSSVSEISLNHRFIGQNPWYWFFNQRKRGFEDTSGMNDDFIGKGLTVQNSADPLSVSGAHLQVAFNKGPLAPFLDPFCSSALGSSQKVRTASYQRGWLYWFLSILRWITLSLLVFCLVGKLYLWYHPLLPPELVWIDGILVEVVEQETWLESYCKWTPTWVCLCFMILVTIIVSYCSFLLDSVSFLVPSSQLENDGEWGYPSVSTRRDSSSSASRCSNGKDDISMKKEIADNVYCHPTSSTAIHPISAFSSTSQSTSKMHSLVGCCTHLLQSFAPASSLPSIRSAKDLDRFVNSTQPSSLRFGRTLSSPLEKDFLSMKPPYSSSAVLDNSVAIPDKSSLANKNLPFFRPLRDDEEQRRSKEFHKGSTRLAWGNSCLIHGGRNDPSSDGGSSSATESPLRLAGRGLEGGISVRYDGREGTEGSPGVSRSAFTSVSSKNITSTSVRKRSQQDERKQLYDTDEVCSLYGTNGAVWTALGLMDAFLVRSAMIKLKERFQQICAELLKRIEESNAWFRACNLADFDCSHSLEETYAAPQTAGFGAVGSFRSGVGSNALGSGAISSFTGGGGMFSSGGGGGAAVMGFSSNTAGSGFGQNTLLVSGETALSGGQAGPSLAKVTKKMYLFQEKEKLRQLCQQAASFSVSVGAGGFGNSMTLRPSVGFTSPSPPQSLNRGEMIEKIQRLEERLELDEKLNVFLTFPLSTVTGSSGTPGIDRVSSVSTSPSGVGTADCARCQQQQQYLIHRMQMWASSSSWNPRNLSPEKSPNEAVGAAAVSEIWHERDGDQHGRKSGVSNHSRTSPLVENDAYLMLHLLRFGIEGLSSFVRSGYLSSSGDRELSLCVGDVGIPYFYVLFRTSVMDIPLSSTLESNETSADAGSACNRIAGLRALFPHQPLSFSSLTRRPVLSVSSRQHVPPATRSSGGGGRLSSGSVKTIRLNPAGWLKKIYLTVGPDKFEGDPVINAISSSGLTPNVPTEDIHEDEEVLLSTNPGPNSLWEALLLFICIVYRFYGGTFHSFQGVMDLKYNGLIGVVAPCTSVLHTRDESRKKRTGAATEPEGWLRGRSLFQSSKEIVV